MVALLGSRGRLDRRRAVVQRRVPLVVLAADEPVERLEPAAARRPRVERTHRRRLPHRHLVALAELRGRVPVQLQRHRQRRLRVRPQRAVARRRRRGLGDAAHADRVVVAAGEHRLARRRAQRGGVEAVVLQAARGESFGGRRRGTDRRTRSTRRSPRRRAARSARSGAPSGGSSGSIGGIRRVRVLRVVRRQTRAPDDPGSATSRGRAGQVSSSFGHLLGRILLVDHAAATPARLMSPDTEVTRSIRADSVVDQRDRTLSRTRTSLPDAARMGANAVMMSRGCASSVRKGPSP